MNRVLTLADLPCPPQSKIGWPWTEQNEPLPSRGPYGPEWPKISIVTPSYNQGQFIEETIRSVLLQGYPDLEFIIIDGGSTDNTVDILRKYDRFITYWVSEKDRGQTHALNKGFRTARGQLMGWQNSDDVYHPGTFEKAALALSAFPSVDVYYGITEQRDQNGSFIRMYPTSEFEIVNMIPFLNMCNQSMLFRRTVFEHNSYLDESFKHSMDLEFFIRLALNGAQFKYLPTLGGTYRVHPDAKGSTQGDVCMSECLRIYKTIYFHPQASAALKERAFLSIYGLSLDAFRKNHLIDFRRFSKEIFRLRLFSKESLKISLKYVLSYLGIDVTQGLKNMLSKQNFI